MTLSEALEIVTQVLKVQYPRERLLRGTEYALNFALRRTRCVQTVGTFTLTSGSPVAAIGGTGAGQISDFRNERLLFCELTTFEAVLNRGYQEVRHKHLRGSSSGKPQFIGFRAPGTAAGTVWPTPDAAYVMSVIYVPPLTDITTGDPTLNIPDVYLRDFLWTLCPAAVEMNNPAALFQSEAWKRGLESIEEIKGECMADVVIDPDLYERPEEDNS